MLTDFGFFRIFVNKMGGTPFVFQGCKARKLTDLTDLKINVNFVNIFPRKVDTFDKKIKICQFCQQTT